MRRALRVCLSLGTIAMITLVYSRLVRVNTTTVALTLLLAVLGIATRWGLLESMIASVAGVLCFNFFFLPPVGTWTIADPQNWVALFAFLITAGVASHLSASARRRAAEATNRQHEMERLYALSRSHMLMDAQSPFAKQIAGHIAETFGLRGVAFYDRAEDEVHRAGPEPVGGADDALRKVAAQGVAFADVGADFTVRPVGAGGKVMGSLALPSSAVSEAALRAIAHSAAIALERARGQEAASRAEAVRQSEELKSAMLDALAHEFKTPLTSIKAAITSILSGLSPEASHRDLVEIVDEETDRLTLLVTEAIQMARIEAGQIELRKGPQSVATLVRRSLARLAGSLESRPVEARVSDGLLPVAADAELVSMAIRVLIDNAVKYSPPHSPITIRAVQEGDWIVVGVADRGPGIPEPERPRIFERFYRGREARERTPGTGMGLAIAGEIVRAHDGDVQAESSLGQGSEFLFRLPVAQGETQA